MELCSLTNVTHPSTTPPQKRLNKGWHFALTSHSKVFSLIENSAYKGSIFYRDLNYYVLTAAVNNHGYIFFYQQNTAQRVWRGLQF